IVILFLFFFNDTATTEIYTLSLHELFRSCSSTRTRYRSRGCRARAPRSRARSEEHTSELQSREKLVCRLLLEKKKRIGTHVLYGKHNELLAREDERKNQL